MNEKTQDREILEKELGEPGPDRIWYVGDAFAAGWSLDEVHNITKIDKWFLVQIEEIVKIELELDKLYEARAKALWRSGCADPAQPQAKGLLRPPPGQAAAHQRQGRARSAQGAEGAPVFKRVDTCAAEFATNTAYMYSTYDEECEAAPTDKKKIMVLGGGPNRIGQGIEFDYCCVHAAMAMREDGYETIMVNCNPETVSTDYDTSDRLYFEPLTLEDVLEIVDKEKPEGVIVQYGGQTPLKLALGLEREGVPIIGTTPDMIDAAEDRERFQKLLQRTGPAPAAQRHRAYRSRSAGKGCRPGLPAGGASLLRAGRPRDGNRARAARPGALHARSREGLQRLARAAGPLPVQRHRVRRGLRARQDRRRVHRRRDGAHRAGRRALR
jgi:carbamoyl-phosphate synthase large subunit